MSSTASTAVLTSIDNHGVATITLSNPGKLNALTEELGDEFSAVVRRVGAEPKLRAVILTGEVRAYVRTSVHGVC